MGSSEHDPADSERFIHAKLAEYPQLRGRILRTLLVALHSRAVIAIDELHEQARQRVHQPNPSERPALADNVQQVQRWNLEERESIHALTVEYAARSFCKEEIEDLVNLTRKREEAQSLEEIANLSSVSFRVLADAVHRFCRLPMGQTALSDKESMAARVALVRHFISEQLEFIGIAKHYMRIRDFEPLAAAIMGSDERMGTIGGKAAGMILAARILEDARSQDPKAPQVPIAIPISFYLRSDVVEQFLSHNGLNYLQDQKYKSSEEIRNEYPVVVEVLKNADFPPAIEKQLAALLASTGRDPLIVRSSSLLEDRFQTAFAGKYRSVFVANQGSDEERLTELLGAIAEVYASTFHLDPISYRQRHNLLDYRENMGVLIQKLVGTRCGDYFLPVWAGVGYSHNWYRRNPRIKPEDGLGRLVLGFGTRAVDRVATDFPRMIPLGMPTLRPEVREADVVRYSQKEVDVINLRANELQSVGVAELLAQGMLPGLNDVISVFDGMHLRRVAGMLTAEPQDAVVTFDRFAKQSPFPGLLRWILQQLERAYGCPVDIEFAHDGHGFHLLQCRPQAVREELSPVPPPTDLPAERRIFEARRYVSSGKVHGVEYMVVIDPRDYDRLKSDNERVAVARAVQTVNERLRDHSFILLGPGRWGSREMRLGVPVGYAGINNTRLLIEIARPRGGYVPEVSFGSHFFHDLVEARIHYLPLYLESEEGTLNEAFVAGAPNRLDEVAPEYGALADVIKVVHVPTATDGMVLNVDMDGMADHALGYLAGQGEG